MTTNRTNHTNPADAPHDDVDGELRFHLDSRTDALVAAGMSAEAARAQARREFGDLEDARRYVAGLDARAAKITRRRHHWNDLRQDLVYGFRRLRAAPGFAGTVILTLALGIGANTAIFSMVNGVLLRPLPFPHPNQLYAVYTANRAAGQLQAAVSAVDLDDWRAERRLIDDVGGYLFAEGTTGIDLAGRGAPRRLAAVFVSPGFFGALGVQPASGRLPREDEMVRGGRDQVALLTHDFWRREFGAASSVIGTTLTLNGAPYDVIGVLPQDLRFPTGDADVFVPFSTIPDSAIPRIRPVRVLSVVARAKPGVTEEDVRSEMATITNRLAGQYPDDRAWSAATVVPLADVVSGPVRPALLVLFGAVGLVLLMACVNVAGLQLTRSMGRGREIAVRLALGAGRGRVIRQLLTESLVLSAIGGVLGLVLAKFSLTGLLELSAGQLPRAAEVTLDPRVIGFAAGLSLLAGLFFGVAPAIRASRGDASLVLRDGGRTITGHRHQRLRLGLVVAEVAVAMMLVVGAGLMGRSFLALVNVDTGFRPSHLLAVQFTIDADRHSPPVASPAPARPGTGAPFTRYYQDVIEKVRHLPGVVSAAAVKDPPLRGNGERNSFRVLGRVVGAGEEPPTAPAIHISDGYFATIGARVDGREFTPHDTAKSPFVVIVNDAFARQYFPGERAVGKTLLVGRDTPVEVVGVVNDIRQVAMATPAAPTIYLDNLQNSRVKTTLVVRTEGEPLAFANTVREAVWSIDPDQAITAVFTFDDAVSRALAQPRLLLVLLGGFGLVGLILGAIGVYGVLSALVSERRRELGVRLALGASPRQVLTMIVRRGFGLACAGVLIGLVGALGLSRFLGAVLYGVPPGDPWTFATTAATLLGAAAIASWLPARRAARLDPLDSLR